MSLWREVDEYKQPWLDVTNEARKVSLGTISYKKSRNGKHSARLTGMFWGQMDVPGKRWKTRPKTPRHVGALKVGLLSVNSPQNPLDQRAHQTHGPTTRPRGPPDQQGQQHIEPWGETVRNSEKLWETVRNCEKEWKTNEKWWETVGNSASEASALQ